MKIGILTVTKRKERLEQLQLMMDAQGIHAFSEHSVTWMIVGHGMHPKMPSHGKTGSVCVGESKDARLYEMRNYGFTALADEGNDVILTFDDDDFYTPNYLLDLVQVMNDYPNGAIYGMNEYFFGWVPEKEGLFFDGSNIYGKRTSRGGSVIKNNQVTWVVDATIAIRGDVWNCYPSLRFGFKPLREDGSEPGGECEQVMAEAARLELQIIARDPMQFCVARLDSPGGWGGAHGHTWGPLMPPSDDPPAAPPEAANEPTLPSWTDLLTTVGRKLDSMVQSEPARKNLSTFKNDAELIIKCRRKEAGMKILPKFLWGIIVEDKNLPVGLIRFVANDGENEIVIKSVSLGQTGD